MRIGHGFDVHRFGEGDHLMIGGVAVPFERGFIAHSDGDVLLHAISDALLGACALGDIGRHFPDTDPAWKGADSRDLLRRVVALVREAGYRVGNLDATLMAQAPKMAPHVGAMAANIADDLGVARGAVNIKATTTERLGFTGRGEGIAAEAVALLLPVAGMSVSDVPVPDWQGEPGRGRSTTPSARRRPGSTGRAPRTFRSRRCSTSPPRGRASTCGCSSRSAT